MKKKLLGLVLVLTLCATLLCGCFNPLSAPTKSDAITGNGGLIAQKGKYLYFVNGYVSTSTLVEGDNKGDEVHSALYRVQLNDNGELEYDENGTLKNVKRVISKIAGTEKAGVFIIDNYVYYATPVTEKNVFGEIQFGLTRFCRIKLDGSSNEVLYTTLNASDSTDWNVVKIKSNNKTKVVLSVYDGTNIISKVVGGNTYTLQKDVTSVVFPRVNDYLFDTVANEEQSYVYYTREPEEDEITYGNVLARRHLLNGEEEILARDGQNTYTAVDFVDNRYTREQVVDAQNVTVQYAGTLYATVADARNNGSAYYHEYMLYDNAGKDLFDTQIASDNQLTYTTYTKVMFPEYEGNYSRGAIAQDSDGKLVWIKYNANTVSYQQFTGMEDDKLTLLAVKGDFAYVVDSSNKVYRMNYKNGTNICVLNYEDDAQGLGNVDFSMNVNVDFDEDHIYMFRSYTGNDSASAPYLVRANTIDNCYNVELVGVLEKAHLYIVEED